MSEVIKKTVLAGLGLISLTREKAEENANIAALIIGSSLILQQKIGPTIFGFSALGILGYLLASIIGLGLIVSILRSGRWK
jgi:hypothetical protein